MELEFRIVRDSCLYIVGVKARRNQKDPLPAGTGTVFEMDVLGPGGNAEGNQHSSLFEFGKMQHRAASDGPAPRRYKTPARTRRIFSWSHPSNKDSTNVHWLPLSKQYVLSTL